MTMFSVNFMTESLVKTIVNDTITISDSSSTGSASIGFVNQSNTLTVWNNWRCADTTTNHAEDLPALTGMTVAFPFINVNVATNTANASDSREVAFSAIEFIPRYLDGAIQYGSITISAGSNSNTDTISSVDTTRSAVFYQGATTTYTGENYGRAMCNLALTDATTVTAERFNTNDDVTVYYAVVQFAADVLKSRQEVTITQTTGTTNTDSAISSVRMDASMIAYGGYKLTGSATTAESVLPMVYLTSSTNVRQSTRAAPTTVLAQTKCTVLEFWPKFVARVARGQSTFASGTSTITPALGGTPGGCHIATSLINYLGANCEDVIATGESRNNATVTEGTQIALSAQVAGTGTPINTISWECIFFR